MGALSPWQREALKDLGMNAMSSGCGESAPLRGSMPDFPPGTETDSGEQRSSGFQTRPKVEGKFLFVGEEKFWIKGVTYGTFRPDEKGREFHDPKKVELDFRLMAENGINALRTYTVPPRWLLDLAQDHGLRVMVGLPWEEHIAFLEDGKRSRSILRRVAEGVGACSGHPAVLCFVVGNEIPAPIVRWHGRRAVERFVRKLFLAAKDEDPEALVTYVNYPSTEYLELDFLDFVCFNVYLESEDKYRAYLARLQNLAGHKPLVMAEIGLDSRRNGLEAQASSLRWQIRSAFSAGCAGTFVFSWTDEWFRGGYDIEDWDFGLTTRHRQAKPALAAVRDAFSELPFPKDLEWPQISVVVCSYNGSRTITDTLKGLRALRYPNFEVIVVDDGSTDSTASIAMEWGARVIKVPNGGLSRARNIGLEAAKGQIVAYIDDDAYPDPDWLQYLAAGFLETDMVALGGPNIPPPGDGPIADCVANAPGGPVHVLLTDQVAEHIPGCNMAFRKEALEAVGGFDPQFRIAGDDVDVCWRLQERGWRIGYCPGAVVWHHRRNSLKAYIRQQKNYGRAEALLEKKWPQKYNRAGHLSWAGRLYGGGLFRPPWLLPPRIYHGVWGSAPFQSLYGPSPGKWSSLPMMPEWYLMMLLLGGLGLLSLLWRPLEGALWVLGGFVFLSLAQAWASASTARFSKNGHGRWPDLVLRFLTASLFLVQPAARLWGRITNGLTPWRRTGSGGWSLPRPVTRSFWSEHWRSTQERLSSLESILKAHGAVVEWGGDYDRWDLEVRGGLLGSVRLLMAVEEHGAGKQQVLVRLWPRFTVAGWIAVLVAAAMGLLAFRDGAWLVGAILWLCSLGLGFWGVGDCAHAMASWEEAMGEPTTAWQ